MIEKIFAWAAIALAFTTMATSCAPRSVPGEVKLALIAPFEGEGRPLGYSALCGVRLAIHDHGNRLPGDGPFVSLIALNDDNLPSKAASQLRAAEQDDDVLVVIGPWKRASANAMAAASPKVPVLVPAPVGAPTGFVHRLFADDAALHEAVVAAAGDGCGMVFGEAKATFGLLECRGESKPSLLVADGDSTSTVRTVCEEEKATHERILAGPDFVRPWTLPLLPHGTEITWFTSWKQPSGDFEAKYRDFCGQAPTSAAIAAYDAATTALDALDRAYRSGHLDRRSVNEEISEIVSKQDFPVLAHTLKTNR